MTNKALLFIITSFLCINITAQSDNVVSHCLAAGTQIRMWDDTMKDIENIQVGDSIMSFDVETQKYSTSKVKKVYSVMHSRLIRITLANDMQILTTYDHPFLSTNGWKSLDPNRTKSYKRYDDVEQYNIGDNLLYYDIVTTNYSTIKSIDGITTPTKTYSLELEGDGAFIANSFLVGQE
ncbi:Hint domain-containing protein [Dysgonomonas sp. ZJ279]|uniref:Hint domain-containing protein n=1 Tax=Dysgonomonas sp. ZJ279 TaxID=2709796 RepID=UPI0013EC33F6|nr:Hint domain-containing protein [Dysgonomonas sp. ZJ279]